MLPFTLYSLRFCLRIVVSTITIIRGNFLILRWRAFMKVTEPMIRAMSFLTPGFLVDRLKPLYVAWFLFLIRFYIMPLFLGYDVMGMLSFPLESEAAKIVYDLGQIFR